MEQTRIAIVGSGNIAKRHGFALQNNPRARIEAVVDIDEENRAAFAAKYGGRPYQTLSERLDAVDAVYALTPPSVRRRIVPNDRRAYKGYVSERLDGVWRPLGDAGNDLFASRENICQTDGKWTDFVSHGELLRAGIDQTMEAAPEAPFLFQGVLHEDRDGKAYAEIPWSLGLLRSLEGE